MSSMTTPYAKDELTTCSVSSRVPVIRRLGAYLMSAPPLLATLIAGPWAYSPPLRLHVTGVLAYSAPAHNIRLTNKGVSSNYPLKFNLLGANNMVMHEIKLLKPTGIVKNLSLFFVQWLKFLTAVLEFSSKRTDTVCYTLAALSNSLRACRISIQDLDTSHLSI